MKYFSSIIFLLSLIVISCDKIDNAYKPGVVTDLDQSFFPGDWADYEANFWPEFAQNANTNRNVLIEDYTGHTCNNCPTAATTAHNLEVDNPGRVFSVGIHAGPGGMTGFQTFNPSANKYYTNHTNAVGLEYGAAFQDGYNFFGNPQGTVNRAVVSNKMFDVQTTWSTRVADMLSENDLTFNLQAVFNYFPETNGGYLHVEVEKVTSAPLETNLVVYVVKNEEVDWQKMPDNSDNPDYVHEHKHLGNIDDQAWGRPLLTANLSSGEKIYEDYSFGLPSNIDPDNLHLLIYVYDTDTYEILQVIKQTIVE